MSWTGQLPPRRLKVITEYEDGKRVRQQMVAQDTGGGFNITEVRCLCRYPDVPCTLHGKEAGDAPVGS